MPFKAEIATKLISLYGPVEAIKAARLLVAEIIQERSSSLPNLAALKIE